MAKTEFNLLRYSIFLIKSVLIKFLVYICNKNRQKINLQLTTLLKDEVNVYYFHANKH